MRDAPRREMTRPPLIFRVTVAAPPEVVFETVFGPPARWLCRSGSFEPREGGTIRLCWPDGDVGGQLVQFVPPSTGRFTWRFEGDPMPETVVVVNVQPTSQQRGGQPVTAVEVEHYAFGAGEDWEPLYLGATRAWTMYLTNLRSVVETGVDLREEDE